MFSFYALFVLLLTAILLFILLLLFIPLDLAFALRLDEKVLRGRFTLKWFFFSYCFSSDDGKWRLKLVGGKWVESTRPWDKFKKAGKKSKSKFQAGKASEKPNEKAAKAGAVKKAEELKERPDEGVKEIREEIKKGIEEGLKEGPEEAKKPGRDFSFYLGAFRALYGPFFRLCVNLLGAAKVREFDFFLNFGFSDPADTGLCCGFLHGLRGVLEARAVGARLGFSPNFLDRELGIKGRTAVRIRLYLLGFSLLKFLFDRRTLGFAVKIFLEKLGRLRPKV